MLTGRFSCEPGCWIKPHNIYERCLFQLGNVPTRSKHKYMVQQCRHPPPFPPPPLSLSLSLSISTVDYLFSWARNINRLFVFKPVRSASFKKQSNTLYWQTSTNEYFKKLFNSYFLRDYVALIKIPYHDFGKKLFELLQRLGNWLVLVYHVKRTRSTILALQFANCLSSSS